MVEWNTMNPPTFSQRFVFSVFIILFGTAAFFIPACAVDIRSIIFPVLGGASYHDDFGDPRPGGRTHEGNDLFQKKFHPLVAAVSGFVRYVAFPQASWGYSVTLSDEDGYQYRYFHVNNDTPGTDDGNGGGINAYAPGMEWGAPVVEGQLIGWLGDSGNAERTSPHLHFEIRRPDGKPINPYASLQASQTVTKIAIAPALPGEIVPFGEFRGGASLAVGNVDADPTTNEVIVGAGQGCGPQVRVFDDEGTLVTQFFAYDKAFRGGVDVAAADTDSDGIAEIITAPGAGTSPEVRVFNIRGDLLYAFPAYGTSMQHGVNVTATDFESDGSVEIVTAPKAGAGPHVRVFHADGTVLGQFFAYAENFRGSVDVAAVPASDEHSALIVTGAGPGGGAQVRIFSPRGDVQGQFFPYGETFRGGVRVTAGDVDTFSPGQEILTVPAGRGSADVRMYNTHTQLVDRETAFEKWWRGGFDIAAGTGTSLISSAQGNRRASVRKVEFSEFSF